MERSYPPPSDAILSAVECPSCHAELPAYDWHQTATLESGEDSVVTWIPEEIQTCTECGGSL